MIVGLHGILEGRGPEGAIVRVGGVSLQVSLPTSTLERLGAVGDKVSLYTYLYFREDAIALYGFASREELGLFKTLLGVSGVGPKLALSLLSVLSPDQLTLAISEANADILTQVPGVGKKTAQRLIFELKGKLEGVWVGAMPESGQADADALAALTSLGYSVAEANRALASLPPDRKLSLEEKVRLALQALGKG